MKRAKIKIVKIALKIDMLLKYLPKVGLLRPLRGTFSAYNVLKSKQYHGEILADRQNEGETRNDSLTSLAGMSQNDHQPWPIFWTVTKNARLVGKPLHWRNSKDEICIEGCHFSTTRRSVKEDRLFAQIIVKKPVRLEGAWTSTVSKWCDGKNYYHWICDGLTRLMIREQLPEKTRILIPNSNNSYIYESLDLLGLKEISHVAPASCIQPERFYFCSPTSMTGVWNPMGYEWLRGAFSKYFTEDKSAPPIFFTRRGVERIPDNILHIEKIFSSYGFKVLDCGSITVKEQIQYASAATAIAGVHGAAMTNILWSQPGTQILEIFQPDYLNGCYEQIANQGKLNYSFMIFKKCNFEEQLTNWIKNLHPPEDGL